MLRSNDALNVPGARTARPIGLHSPIGRTLDILRGELCDLGHRLGDVLEGPAKKLIEDLHRRLQAMVCPIVVIGQVKAGKSSFINCLVRQPGLMPTDVNPWTTAVTRLHFGRRDVPEGVAAEFRFFDRDEWQQLAAGSGRVRELTEKLVPGFEAAQLARQLETMRLKTSARLGSELEQLLGTSHSFPHISHAVLEAYVCSGLQVASDDADNEPGRYSDVTKSADLYLNGNLFAFPATVIDTPGTNDPFLVRDEITRRSLDAADLYVVVLTARQALSAADVALLRILRGLRKERLVVFVNRIDELDDLEGELEAVQAQVEDGLSREFRDVEIPIVYGSALWATQALARGSGLSVTPALRAYAARVASTDGSGFGANADYGTADLDDAELLFLCSGMAHLVRTLDHAMLNSHSAHVIRHLTGSFAELSRVGRMAARDEMRQLSAEIGTAVHSTSAAGKEAGELAAQLQGLRALAPALEGSVKELEAALRSMAEAELRMLESTLQRTIGRFAEAECARLGEAMHHGDRGRVWSCDTAPLRRALAEDFWQWFRYAEAKLMAAEAEILPSLQHALARSLPSHLNAPSPVLQPTPMQSPSVSALGRVVALDLDAPWWKVWWTGKRADHERARELDRLIGLEFTPIAQDLVGAARMPMLQQISATAEQAGAVCLSIAEQLRAQGERHAARMGDMARVEGAATAKANSMHRFRELNDQLEVWDSICARFDTLKAVCARLAWP